MGELDKPKKNPWGPPHSPEFIALDKERIMHELLAQIRQQMNRFGKEANVTYEVDDGADYLSFSILDGDADTLRAHVANVVGSTNDDLAAEGSALRLGYESTHTGALITVVK